MTGQYVTHAELDTRINSIFHHIHTNEIFNSLYKTQLNSLIDMSVKRHIEEKFFPYCQLNLQNFEKRYKEINDKYCAELNSQAKLILDSHTSRIVNDVEYYKQMVTQVKASSQKDIEKLKCQVEDLQFLVGGLISFSLVGAIFVIIK
jgi:hypothetical protein